MLVKKNQPNLKPQKRFCGNKYFINSYLPKTLFIAIAAVKFKRFIAWPAGNMLSKDNAAVS
jgi:hypothetical protein